MKTAWNKGLKKKTPCKVCGGMVSYDKWGKPVKTCSPECLKELRSEIGKAKYSPPSRLGKRVKGAKHRRVTVNRYVELYEGDGKHATRIYEHRKVMQDFLKRKLKTREQVHHVNGDKIDNRIENLMLFANASEHAKFHTERISL